MDSETDTHIFTVIIPAVDAVIHNITALINHRALSARPIDPGWIVLNYSHFLLNDLKGDISIGLNPSNN